MTRVYSLAVVAGLLATSCAKDRLIITGQAMIQLSDQFVVTAKLMDDALDKGVITPHQYKVWRQFGEKFQKTYPLAVQMWKVAESTGNEKLSNDMLMQVNQLAMELVVWSGTVMESK